MIATTQKPFTTLFIVR